MADIVFEYHDHLHCRVHCDKGTAYEIYDTLSFYVPGYKFHPKYKAGLWDGKIRLLSLKTGLVYKNLIPQVMRWADENNYTYTFKDKEKFRPAVKWDKGWIDRWAEYGRMEPMAHQREYINDAMTLNQALLLSPTSSGKSYVMYLCMRYLLEHQEGSILITVPSTSLVEQLMSDFKDYAVDWDVDANVQMLYGGLDKKVTKRVLVSTWQSIYKNPPAFFKDFHCFMCDEAHGADAKSISGIIDKLPNGGAVRLGLTGTLDGTQIHELEMKGRFGPLVKKITTRQLMDLGLVADLRIQCYRLKYTTEECKAVKAAKNYQAEIDYILGHQQRNELLVRLALTKPGNTLMLVNYVERHGDVLYKMLEAEAEAHGKTLYYITGKVSPAQRETIRQLMETRSDVVLLATYGTLSTGISIKNLDNIIFGHPYKARIKNLQSIGRGLRMRPGKTFATLYDIGDDFTYKARTREHLNHLITHFIKRLEVYQSEEFDYDVHDMDIL